MTLFGRMEETVATGLFSRAARAAGMPLAIHIGSGDKDAEHLLGSWGRCRACDYVNAMPAGQRACREDRQRAAAMARKLGQPVSFVCHMGFGCTALAVDFEAEASITLGPWCPQENDQALAFDACRGLAKLNGQKPREEFPTTLADIHRCPSGVAEAVLSWLKADIDAVSDTVTIDATDTFDESDDASNTVPIRRHAVAGAGDANTTAMLVAAALAGNRAKARQALEAALAELKHTARPACSVKYLHMLGEVFRAMAALESRGVDTVFFQRRVVAEHAIPENEDAFRAALLLFSRTLCQVAHVEQKKPDKQRSRSAARQSYPELDSLLRGKLADPPELREVANALGKSPAAVTRQLQRDLGLSYTGYVGKLRIESAKELLRRTNLPIDAVAKRMGFSDSSNFRRSFRKFAGQSPTAYREQFGKK